MSADKMRMSLEAKRNENLAQLQSEKGKQFNQIEQMSAKEKTRVGTETNMQIASVESQQGELQSHIASLESALASMPPGHPERGKVEKALGLYRKRLAEMQEMVQKLKSRLKSHMQMINFQTMMRKKNVEINVVRQTGMIKARFAEIIGNALAGAEQSDARMSKGEGGRKEMATASG